MLIQPILFPPKNLINEPELFFRGVDHQNVLNDKVIIPAGKEVSLETYFNAFSIGKWLEYTHLDNLSLNLRIQGDVEIRAYHAVGWVDSDFYNQVRGKYSEDKIIRLINEESYSAARREIYIHISQIVDKYTVNFPHLEKDGIFYITIKAITDATLLGGDYSTKHDESLLNPIKLAVGICTFKREDAVYNNVGRILADVINNTESPLSDKLEVYIADNGKTIDANHFNNDKVHVFPNPNLGGSGGFTRTMIEAMFYDRAKAFTHIIFMDDDILLYPPVLERTYYLLQLLKSEYQKSILGAASILLEKPYIQQESGALYRDKTLYIGRANHKGFNLKKTDAIAANEVSAFVNYAGWWYACIPRTIISEKNLPMPFFIHYDDAEYSLRNIKNRLLFINGICVWHPSPTGKNPFGMVYYDIRNRLITMFSKELAFSDFKEYLHRITKLFFLKVVRYDYEDIAFILAGIEDFLKGPKSFFRLDAVEFHTELIKKKDITFAPKEIGITREQIVEKRYKNFKIAVIIQFICNLLPARKKIYAINSKYFNIPYTAEIVYLYNERMGRGIIQKRNQKEFLRLLFSFLRVCRLLKKGYNQLLSDWQAAKPTLTSLPFWEKYLGIDKEITNE